MSAFDDALQQIVNRRASLTADQAFTAMREVMAGQVAPELLAAFLVALRMKGETVDEIVGFARAMRGASVRITPARRPLVDTCGTGGDAIKTFNISTAAAFVVAGASVAVAKHGNRSVTSSSGSADVWEALGLSLDRTPEQIKADIEQVGIGFLFAPAFHPAMKHAAPVRKALGMRTVFNVLGPLTNPAGATAQVVGVFSEGLIQPIGAALAALGTERALVVHGEGGLDELSTMGQSLVGDVRNGQVDLQRITHDQFGLPRAKAADLAAGTPAENAARIESVLRGEKGPPRDIVALNAAAGLVASGVVEDLAAGVAKSIEVIDSGAAQQVLVRLRTAHSRR